MKLDFNYYQTNPLYISQLQKKIADLPAGSTQDLIIQLILTSEGGSRYTRWNLPTDEIISENTQLWERYVCALLNNFIVTFGGEQAVIYADKTSSSLSGIISRAIKEFQLENPLNTRTGYGVYVNYINRMNPTLGLSAFSMEFKYLSCWEPPSGETIVPLCDDNCTHEGLALLRRAATTLEGRSFCSLDVGGNSIKGAVVTNGEILFLKEHRWYPSGCKTSEEMLSPIIGMVALLGQSVAAYQQGGDYKSICSRLAKSLTCEELVAATKAWVPTADLLLDAVVVGFPDIVVKNKISGGETFKQIGMKKHAGADYDAEFAKTQDLDEYLRRFVRPEGEVVVLNDGNAAAFVTSVEQAFAKNSIIDSSVMFANTIGTEMGTGLVSTAGTIQYFPLEGYQKIIDLGNLRYCSYPAEDIRSLRSLSTDLSGTVQKHITQLGLFRMAIVALMQSDPLMVDGLIADQILLFDKEKDLLTVMTQPQDKRGELTRRLMALLDSGHPVLQDTFRSMGTAIGVLIDQGRYICPEISLTRLLSGGIVASDNAFGFMLEGLKAYNPEYNLTRLDEDSADSPLLQKMDPQQRNFSTAIGSAYIGNYVLLAKDTERKTL